MRLTIVFCCVLFIGFAPAGAHAQLTGLGSDGNLAEEPDARRGGLYVRGGGALATGAYGSAPSGLPLIIDSESLLSAARTESYGATGGFVFELGLVRNIDLVFLLPSVGVGIDGSVSYSSVGVDWAAIYPDASDLETGSNEQLVQMSIGPVVSYQVHPLLVLSGYAKAGWGYAYGSTVSGRLNVHGAEMNMEDDNAYDFGDGGLGMRKALGVNARHNALGVGLELNWGTHEYGRRYRVEEMDEWSSVNTLEWYNADVSISTMRLYLSYSFL